MASNPPPDLPLAPLGGKPHPVLQWLTTFHMLFVAVDPFSHPSAWIVDTAARLLTNYDQADCRVAFLVGGTADEARRFLGPWADEVLTFADPDLVAIRGFGLQTLPACVSLAMDGTILSACEGWDPPCWRALSAQLERIVGWKGPVIPGARDPAPFEGAPLTAA